MINHLKTPGYQALTQDVQIVDYKRRVSAGFLTINIGLTAQVNLLLPCRKPVPVGIERVVDDGHPEKVGIKCEARRELVGRDADLNVVNTNNHFTSLCACFLRFISPAGETFAELFQRFHPGW